jgi:eukaryotic-like serine/threonine-protein kinase
VSSKLAATAEPISGYTLTERIGAGGYGEVWKARAPGGLTKALKIVFGQMQDQWAACELRSLRRIKEVRHPFILSIERIEVVEGQLVIVTELADGSLSDRYRECRESGLAGIPRDELLGYLSDAAEALDYMREKFSLQHLDVKPENLLTVGGRVKIADFGLVRNIVDPQRSAETPSGIAGDGCPVAERGLSIPALGGLTPRYASPELFDGQPSIHSDQYSLAIVYQELLTGVPSFPGETAEQLAAQHHGGAPRLTPLPPADRPIIARALAKDSGKRFASCRDLIAALRSPAHAEGRQFVEMELRHSAPQGHADTAVAGYFESSTETGMTPHRQTASASGGQPAPMDVSVNLSPMPVVDLPPIELSGQDRLRPTLWLGIGGTAAAILRHLRRRLHARFSDLSGLPALQMLLVDTDRDAMAQATQGSGGEALQDSETLLAPLRRTQDYRERSEEYLRWLSRRWLYNIPSSRLTEGFRPLGRLAFVDHADEITRRLRAVLKVMTAPESLAATSKITGMEFRDPTPRVFLIASISGGTGSGMMLDMAHAAQAALHHLELPAQSLCGLLLHSTSHVPERKTLAIADAYACLREWKYWQVKTACRETPSSSPVVAGGHGHLLPQSYLVHLGDDIGEQEFELATDNVAAYLCLDVATSAGEFLDKCRHSQSTLSEPEIGLRTLGLCQPSYSVADLTHEQRLDRLRSGALRKSFSTSGSGRDLDPSKLRLWALPHARPNDLLPLDPNSEHDRAFITAGLEMANPRLLAGGGSRRLLLAIPKELTTSETQQQLATLLGYTPTIIACPLGEMVFCYEVECLDVDRMAALLVGQRSDCAHMAERLYTRTDIAWTGQHVSS